MPLDSIALHANDLVQFPIAIGGVVLVVNIDGVHSGDLKLTGPVLADVFMGKVVSWDDASIMKLNPGLHLRHLPIVVVHRQDGSGTTFNFVNYLSQVSEDWRDLVGTGMFVNWPVGVGTTHNGGVADAVKRTPGAIGYVEPSSASFAAAAAGANWRSEPDFRVSVADAPAALVDTVQLVSSTPAAR